MNSIVGKRYALALFSHLSSAEAKKQTEQDFTVIKATVLSSAELKNAFSSPIIKPFKKVAIMNALFQERVSKETLRFLIMLVEKNRGSIVIDTINEFEKLLDEERGIINVIVRTASALDKQDEESLSKKLNQLTGKTVRLALKKDISLIGGLHVQIDDTVIDGSLKHQLKQLHEQLVK